MGHDKRFMLRSEWESDCAFVGHTLKQLTNVFTNSISTPPTVDQDTCRTKADLNEVTRMFVKHLRYYIKIPPILRWYSQMLDAYLGKPVWDELVVSHKMFWAKVQDKANAQVTQPVDIVSVVEIAYEESGCNLSWLRHWQLLRGLALIGKLTRALVPNVKREEYSPSPATLRSLLAAMSCCEVRNTSRLKLKHSE